MVADQAMDYPQKRGDGIQFKNQKLRIQLGKELLHFGASKSIKDNYRGATFFQKYKRKNQVRFFTRKILLQK